jgi:hypothetical protein
MWDNQSPKPSDDDLRREILKVIATQERKGWSRVGVDWLWGEISLVYQVQSRRVARVANTLVDAGILRRFERYEWSRVKGKRGWYQALIVEFSRAD